MDFEKLLKVARKNELKKKEPVKYLQTKFKPPTKEQHEKDKILSEGVQRFLARKEQEEKNKLMEAEKRKQELMALRSKDPKANKRIQTMLKRTKSANKSVMEDAVDNNNTADTLAGPSQPDEDDYGFVSETSSQLYNKLIQKMYSTPSNDLPKFAPSKKPSGNDLSHTKERVKMALLKQEEEEKLPHKRKRKEKEKSEDDVSLGYGIPDRDLSQIQTEQNNEKKEKTKIKIQKAVPPPVDFQELLKIAEKKQHEPIVFEPKKKKVEEPEILMTKKQKIEYEKMQEWKRKRELKSETSEKSLNVNSKANSRIPKTGQSGREAKAVVSGAKSTPGIDERPAATKGNFKVCNKSDSISNKNNSRDSSDKPEKNSHSESSFKTQPSGRKFQNDEMSQLLKERDEVLRTLKEKEKLIRERDEAVRILKEKEQLIRERDEAVRKLKLLEQSEKIKSVKCEEPKPQKFTSNAKGSNKRTEDVRTEARTSCGPQKNEQFRDAPEKPRLREPPAGNPRKAVSRDFPRTNRLLQKDVRRKSAPFKKRRIESDDEYDSDLDGFIDDDENDVGSEEVSKVISEIFRYDKNKYSAYDDADDECMESNFAQISKEEFFSTKCGILEDLKDVQREKAKLAKKKKK